MKPRKPGDSADLPQQPRVLDVSRLRLLTNSASVRQLPVRPRTERPPRTCFFRTRPGPDFCLETYVLEVGGSLRPEPFLLVGELGDLGPAETVLVPVTIRLAVTREGHVYVWPLRIPSQERPNRWHLTALQAARLAETKWVRMTADMSLGEYVIYEALDDLGKPAFPDEPFALTVTRAFEERLIEDLDHPALRQLRGQR